MARIHANRGRRRATAFAVVAAVAALAVTRARARWRTRGATPFEWCSRGIIGVVVIVDDDDVVVVDRGGIGGRRARDARGGDGLGFRRAVDG